MNLTTHFSLEELTFSSTGERLGLDNTPDDNTRRALLCCAMGLEKVRALLGSPLHIDSGYRSPAVNKAVGGVPDSAHVQGYAADFKCPEYGTPLMIARAIAGSDIYYDQCIFEGSWCHISFDPRMRHQLMTANFGAGGTTYTKGA